MDGELKRALEQIMADAPQRVVLSAPAKGCAYTRAQLRPLDGGWQLEKRTATQAFHENIPAARLVETLAALLQGGFGQLTALGTARQHALRLTKKGRVLVTSQAAVPQKAAAQPPAGHDRQKTRLLAEGEVVPPLVDVGVMTPDGRIKAAMAPKWRQINRFLEMVDDILPARPPQTLRVADFGCGKSYLTFVLYHYLEKRGIRPQMVGLDLKADVVAGCNAAAERYGYSGLHFEVGDIAGYEGGQPVDMLVTLHACDTATDHALARAVGWGARYILSVPCCQHELNAQMREGPLPILSRYGLVKERTAALMTDAVRANLLYACGWKAQLLEFVELEHTPKNIMLRAVRRQLPPAERKKALREAQDLCDAFGFEPTLLGLLRQQGGALPE